MNSKNILTIAVTLMVGVILTAGVLTPVIADTSSTTRSIENEGAQWVRMAYVSDDADYSVSVDVDGDVTITNGENVQTGSVTDMIIYADSLCSVFISDGDIILVGSNGNSTQMIRLGDSFTIERASGVLTIGDGTSVYQPSGSVEWAYVPIGTGTYGSFGAGGLQRDQTPLVAVGSFAGVGCYNNFITPDYGLVMDADVTSEYINSVKWALGLGGQDDDAEQEVEQTDPSPSPSLTVFDSPEPDADGGEDPVPMDVSPETDAGDGDSDTELTRGETEGSGGLRSVPSATYTDGDWGYELYGNPQVAQIVSYSGAGGIVTIPSMVGGYDVKIIGKGNGNYTVFPTSLSVSELIISPGPTKIHGYAFYQCSNIESVSLPDTITEISMYAFLGCTGLANSDLHLPSSLETIETGAFRECSGLTGSLVIPNTVRAIGSDAFTGCSGLTGTLTLSTGLTIITGFSNCGFTGTLTIPNGVTTISNNAFFNCSGFTGELVLPDTLRSVGGFSGCTGLTGTLTIPNGVTTIDNSAFAGCTGFDSLIIPNTVTQISNYAFDGCTGLTGELSLPSTISSIGLYAFRGCTGLTGLVVPSSVSSIASYAFDGCTGLRNLSWPIARSSYNIFNNVTGLTSISFTGESGYNYVSTNGANSYTKTVWYLCRNNLSSVSFEEGVKSIGDYMFNLNSTFTSLSLPSTLVSIGDYAFSQCRAISSLTLPTGIESIGTSAFNQCNALSGTLTLPATLNTIGSMAFFRCNGLSALSISSGLVSIGSQAFCNCYGLAGSLTIPDSVMTIGNSAFFGCTGLTGSLTVSNSDTSLGTDVFKNCTGLTALSWPISLSSAGNFTGVSNLTSITLTGTGDSADYSESDYQTTPQYISRANLTTVTISEGVTSAGDYLLAGCSSVTSLSIPSTLTEIGDHAFYQCAGLTGAFTLPQGVTSVGDYAFNGCGYSGELDIGNMSSIGDYAFSGCTFTGTLILPAGLTSVGDNAFSDSSFDNMIVMSDATPSSDAFSGMAVSQVLNLSDTEYTKTSYGLNANEVRDEIDADSYICMVSYEETVYKEGAIYSLLPVIPLIAVAGLVIGIGMSVMRRGGV